MFIKTRLYVPDWLRMTMMSGMQSSISCRNRVECPLLSILIEISLDSYSFTISLIGSDMLDPLKLSIYSTKSLKAWALRTDVLELSKDFCSLAAACLCKWARQLRWYLASNAIISPSDNFPIKDLSLILWAHDLTLASKPRVEALVSFSVVLCSQRKHMSPGSVDKLLSLVVELMEVLDRLVLTGLDDVKDEARFFCRCRALLVEQIIAYGRRIVQIMIQATDLAQILYRGHPSRKKRATQNFNMAAIFQDGRHGLSWNPIFCLKRAADGWKRQLWK